MNFGVDWSKKRLVLLTRWLVVIIISYLIIFGQGLNLFSLISPESLLILIYVISNVILTFQKESFFDHKTFDIALFFFDTTMISLGIYTAGVIGFLASAASLSIASMKYLQEGLFSPLIMASNACLILLAYHISLHKGLYTNKRIAVYTLSTAIIETGFIAASLSKMYLVSFNILCVTAAYFFYERSKGYNLYKLLQYIIK